MKLFLLQLFIFFGTIISAFILAHIYSEIKMAKKKKRKKLIALKRKANLEKAKLTPLGQYLQEFYLSKNHWDKVYYYQTPSSDDSIVFNHHDGAQLVFEIDCYNENIIELKTARPSNCFSCSEQCLNKVELREECIKKGFSLIEFFKEKILLGYEERLKYNETKKELNIFPSQINRSPL